MATFRGEATLSYDHEARRITIDGRGIDGRGASRAIASGTVVAGGTDTTQLKIDGSFNVTGPLETFANAGGVHVARALLGEFAQNMAALVAERGAPAAPEPAPTAVTGADPYVPETPAPEPAPPPRPAAELSAGKLLWQAFLSWVKSLFGAKRA